MALLAVYVSTRPPCRVQGAPEVYRRSLPDDLKNPWRWGNYQRRVPAVRLPGVGETYTASKARGVRVRRVPLKRVPQEAFSKVMDSTSAAGTASICTFEPSPSGP
jgi:hypothetical protein